jgi:hypothetical protein
MSPFIYYIITLFNTCPVPESHLLQPSDINACNSLGEVDQGMATSNNIWLHYNNLTLVQADAIASAKLPSQSHVQAISQGLCIHRNTWQIWQSWCNKSAYVAWLNTFHQSQHSLPRLIPVLSASKCPWILFGHFYRVHIFMGIRVGFDGTDTMCLPMQVDPSHSASHNTPCPSWC